MQNTDSSDNAHEFSAPVGGDTDEPGKSGDIVEPGKGGDIDNPGRGGGLDVPDRGGDIDRPAQTPSEVPPDLTQLPPD